MSAREQIAEWLWWSVPSSDDADADADAKAKASAMLDAFAAEVVAARDAQIIAWLGKKAREYKGNRAESASDVLARMASKIARGAVRPSPTRGQASAPQAELSDTARQLLTFGLTMVADRMASWGEEFDADGQRAMAELRGLADPTRRCGCAHLDERLRPCEPCKYADLDRRLVTALAEARATGQAPAPQPSALPVWALKCSCGGQGIVHFHADHHEPTGHVDVDPFAGRACPSCGTYVTGPCPECAPAPQPETEPSTEGLRERIKQALSDAGAFCGVCGFQPGDRGCPDCERCWDDYADAVLTILAAGKVSRQAESTRTPGAES